MILTLENDSGQKVAVIIVKSHSEDLITGLIINEEFPTDQKRDFKEFEDLVNDQVLSLVDSATEKIEAHKLGSAIEIGR